MSMDYIRRHYGPSIKRGARVVYSGSTPNKVGTIIGSDGFRLRVRLDGETKTRNFHPSWEIRVLEDGEVA